MLHTQTWSPEAEPHWHYHPLAFHLSINFHFSTIRSQWQQVKQGIPVFTLLSRTLEQLNSYGQIGIQYIFFVFPGVSSQLDELWRPQKTSSLIQKGSGESPASPVAFTQHFVRQFFAWLPVHVGQCFLLTLWDFRSKYFLAFLAKLFFSWSVDGELWQSVIKWCKLIWAGTWPHQHDNTIFRQTISQHTGQPWPWQLLPYRKCSSWTCLGVSLV